MRGVAVPDSFTVLWSQDRCADLRRQGQTGARLELLFGGPHVSQPSFRRAGVRPGDYVYPIHLHSGELFVLGRLRVREIVPLEQYIRRNPEQFATYPMGSWVGSVLSQWLADHPEKRYL